MNVANSHNLKAYDQVESLSLFENQVEIENYRFERLNACQPIIEFIRSRLYQDKPFTVLDIGSGSSNFLYAMDNHKLLHQGYGIEISKTRHKFAELWATEKKYKNVHNICDDIRNVQFQKETFELCTILDHTFTYFYPIEKQLPEYLLKQINLWLKKDGYILTHFSTYAHVIKQLNKSESYNIWIELPETNNFKYSLYQYNFMPEDKKIVKTESRYLFRDTLGEKSKIEYSKAYTLEDMEDLFSPTSIQIIEAFDSFEGKPYEEGMSESLVLLGRKC